MPVGKINEAGLKSCLWGKAAFLADAAIDDISDADKISMFLTRCLRRPREIFMGNRLFWLEKGNWFSV